MLDLEFAELSDPGLVRDHKEHALGHLLPESSAQVHSQGCIFALADGVGDHENAGEAAGIAVERVLDGFRRIPKGVMHVSLLPRLVQEANVAVYNQANREEAHGGGMATTLLVCALRFDSAVLSHVGDSRCYLIRRGVAAALTRDHMPAGDVRRALTRSLGTEPFVAADTSTVNIAPGDMLMLCTGGLHRRVPQGQMETILSPKGGACLDLKAAAKALVEAAKQSGGQENVSVQLIRVKSVERMGLYRGRPYRL